MDAEAPATIESISALRDGATCIAFVLGIVGTLLRTLIGPSPFDELAENRRIAEIPKFTWKDAESYPGRLEQAFSDRLAFRPRLVRLGNRSRMAIGVSPSPKVIIGKRGFLFYAGEESLTQFRHQKPFSQRELATWRTVLDARHDFLATRGIRYLFLVPPNKETAYGELMPPEYTRERRPSRLDQLLQFMKQSGRAEMLDLRPAVAAARRGHLAYYRTDTHWNDRGAFAAYGSIAQFLRGWLPAIEPIPAASTVMDAAPYLGGDLSGLLGLRDVITEPVYDTVRLRSPRAREADPHVPTKRGTPPHAVPWAREVDDARLPRMMAFHDSFMNGIRPFLAENFRRTVSLSTHDFPTAVIDRERPDVVIEEILERFLMGAAPANPPEVNLARRPALEATSLGMDEPAPPGEPLPSVSTWARHDLDTDGSGTLLATGADPYIATAVPPIDTTRLHTVYVRMTLLNANGSPPGARFAQLFWARAGAHYEERTSQRFVVRADGVEHRYRIRLDLSRADQGPLINLRLDLPAEEVGLRAQIVAVEVGD